MQNSISTLHSKLDEFKCKLQAQSNRFVEYSEDGVVERVRIVEGTYWILIEVLVRKFDKNTKFIAFNRELEEESRLLEIILEALLGTKKCG